MTSKSDSFRTGRMRVLLLTVLGAVFATGLSPGPAIVINAPEKPHVARRIATRRESKVFYDVHRFGRISFIVDTSGNMESRFWTLGADLQRVVDSLSPSQSFNIAYYGATDDQLAKDHRYQKPELLRATAENKAKARRFLQGLCTTGYRDPEAALESAFEQNSDVIYLVTAYDFADNDAVLKKIRELNAHRRVKIYTIALVGKSDTDVTHLKLLKTIAAKNHGRFRYVREWELQ